MIKKRCEPEALDLDLYVDTGWQLQPHERVNRFGR